MTHSVAGCGVHRLRVSARVVRHMRALCPRRSAGAADPEARSQAAAWGWRCIRVRLTTLRSLTGDTIRPTGRPGTACLSSCRTGAAWHLGDGDPAAERTLFVTSESVLDSRRLLEVPFASSATSASICWSERGRPPSWPSLTSVTCSLPFLSRPCVGSLLRCFTGTTGTGGPTWFPLPGPRSKWARPRNSRPRDHAQKTLPEAGHGLRPGRRFQAWRGPCGTRRTDRGRPLHHDTAASTGGQPGRTPDDECAAATGDRGRVQVFWQTM